MRQPLVLVILVLFGLLTLLPVSGEVRAETIPDQGTAGNVKKDIAEAYQSLKSYSLKQKNEAVKKSKNLLDDLDARLDAFEERLDKKWVQMDQQARERSRAALRSLRKQRDRLADRYYELKYSSGQAWEEIKKGFIESYRAVTDSFEKAAKEF